METVMERECSALGGLFQTVISDMKGSFPIWDDFINKAGKLHSQIRATVVAVAAFLDAFQKVADLASNSRGGTRDLGSALTKMCLRHRSIETRLRHLSMVFVDCLINPLQEQMEDWRRTTNSLDKDHAKEYKKARQEIKKRSSDTLKLQKKAKKVRAEQAALDSALQLVSGQYQVLEEAETCAVRRALVEERGRFCCLVSMLRPIMDEEVSLLGEMSHLQSLSEDLRTLSMDPHKLPPSSEQVLTDLKSSDCSWSFQSPPSSPGSTSRKSSMSSSVNSVSSGDSRSSGSPHFRFRSGSGPVQSGSVRLSSVSSHDSGFNSQDYSSRSPTALPSVSALKRSRTADPINHHSDDITAGEEPRAQRHLTVQTKEHRDPREELVQALARGLSLDSKLSYRDSAYSSQTHTPSCSEDQTGSDGDNFSVSSEADPQTPDQEKFGFPRNSDQSLSYRRLYQTKCTSSAPTPGVATIRRAPSSKPSLRRPSLGLNLGLNPGPVRPPMIPVKTPTVPEARGGPEPPSPPPQPSARVEAERRAPVLPELLEETETEDYLVLIRRGVKLKRNRDVRDRSAPFIH
ncbi:protein MTSS 2 isoform X2 [Boleophthalmus pectinirostris]|uniref:protein MTSS 2 isoform X2 n=1 Tax=Boleophthalmus pectinirostris TaxID=150288 RepID=UPI000A1C7573|nr:protein MTSS 2 isoform X2 [Boleophthalmus pectinirostris]